MDEEDQFLSQVLSEIAEAEIITIFLPLLRRALVVDTRQDELSSQLVRVMPQAKSMEERIHSIEKQRPHLGKVRSILGIPWIKSVRELRECGIEDRLVERLSAAGMPQQKATSSVRDAILQLWGLEQLAFTHMIRGEGYATIWAAKE